MLSASCHCGAVKIEIDAELTDVTDCNCSICRLYGALWAYYALDQVRLAFPPGSTDVYMWDDRAIEFHRCRECGCVTHWYPVDEARNRMGVNARMLPLDVRAKARVRRLDGAGTEGYLD